MIVYIRSTFSCSPQKASKNRELLNMKERIPEWLKPAAIGGIIGAIALVIVAFSAGWVMTSSSAQEMAEQQGEKAVLAALTPICVAQFKAQTEQTRTTQLTALEGESSWTRDDFVEEHGWATMPGSTEPNNEVANACATQLMELAKT
jgi:hypothetical protein